MDPASVFSFFFLVSMASASSFTEYIYPNITVSNFKFIDNTGTFLTSRNKTYEAAIFNPGGQQQNFYLCVIHVASGTVIWTANRDASISNSGQMILTVEGIIIVDNDRQQKWSTPSLSSSVSALRLTEIGNLVLLDQFNGSIWESFNHPTDTIVMDQHLSVGTTLASAVSDSDMSTGRYQLQVTVSDAVLQWNQQVYWQLSRDTYSYTNSTGIVDYMTLNRTGLFLLGLNGTMVVIQVMLPVSDFRIARLDSSGQFTVTSFHGVERKLEFAGPTDVCQIPFVCGRLGFCDGGSTSSAPVCSCPTPFHRSSDNRSACLPNDSSYDLPSPCNSSTHPWNSSLVSYLALGNKLKYFANGFSSPEKYGLNLSACQDLCSGNCSCLGVFYKNSVGSCYIVKNEMGSLISSSAGVSALLGYIKVVQPHKTYPDNDNRRHVFTVLALVLIPFTAFFLFTAVVFLWCRRQKIHKTRDINLVHYNSSPSSCDLDAFYISGLPKRFDYDELELATDNFSTQIGSGGFGSVYKALLPDSSVVAVKKINDIGMQGKKDFFTEIAVIGNIHHVNLVKLKGFCAQGRHRLLVYEYMSRGSLDRTLFGIGPVLEWQERFEIALGMARGLAYLHSGCEKKIIHCDIKPENILLHDNFQVKISDFGLSKLLGPEQSSLFTRMRGTRGYLAPEWLTNSAITEKTDVYSFGMVLLELVSGRKNCYFRSRSQSVEDSNGGSPSTSSSTTGLIYFPLHALEMHEQQSYLELADSRLEGRVRSEEAEKLVRIALCCVHEEPKLRPNMVTVVGMLEGEIPLWKPRMESLNFLRFYGRRFAEASTIEEEEQNEYSLRNQHAEYHPPITNNSHAFLSYISSQNISGPR